jgi:hypothetical protein
MDFKQENIKDLMEKVNKNQILDLHLKNNFKINCMDFGIKFE